MCSEVNIGKQIINIIIMIHIVATALNICVHTMHMINLCTMLYLAHVMDIYTHHMQWFSSMKSNDILLKSTVKSNKVSDPLDVTKIQVTSQIIKKIQHNNLYTKKVDLVLLDCI